MIHRASRPYSRSFIRNLQSAFGTASPAGIASHGYARACGNPQPSTEIRLQGFAFSQLPDGRKRNFFVGTEYRFDLPIGS